MRITKFEELAEKAVPWFIAVCLAVILWAVTGCGIEEKPLQKGDGSGYMIHEIEHDGCQYLFIYGNSIIHKANCKNPIHKCENLCP